MLAKPLRLLFDNEPNVRQRSLSPRKKRNTPNRRSIQYSDEDSLSIGSSDNFDEDDSDHDDESDVDSNSNSNSNGYDDAANQDFSCQKHQLQGEEDEPLAKKLRERKENEPLATRILKRKENESLVQRLQQQKNLDQDKNSLPLAPPNPIKSVPQSGGSRSGSGLKAGSGSKSGSGSKFASGTATTKVYITNGHFSMVIIYKHKY